MPIRRKPLLQWIQNKTLRDHGGSDIYDPPCFFVRSIVRQLSKKSLGDSDIIFARTNNLHKKSFDIPMGVY